LVSNLAAAEEPFPTADGRIYRTPTALDGLLSNIEHLPETIWS